MCPFAHVCTCVRVYVIDDGILRVEETWIFGGDSLTSVLWCTTHVDMYSEKGCAHIHEDMYVCVPLPQISVLVWPQSMGWNFSVGVEISSMRGGPWMRTNGWRWGRDAVVCHTSAASSRDSAFSAVVDPRCGFLHLPFPRAPQFLSPSNTTFCVVGCLGSQGVGKSSILSSLGKLSVR